MRCTRSSISRATLSLGLPVVLAASLLIGCAKEAVNMALPGGSPGGGQICYDGADGSGSACLPVVAASAINDADYVYPDPFTDPTFPRRFNPELYRPPQRFVDLGAVDINQTIVPNFGVHEFMNPDKGRYAVFSRDVARIIARMREASGAPLIVNSGFRSRGYNDRTDGSATWSRHPLGDGVDIKSTVLSRRELRDLCREFGSSFERLYSGHVHCDWRNMGGDAFFIEPGGVMFAMNVPNGDSFSFPRVDAEHIYGGNEKVRVKTNLDENGDPILVFFVVSEIEEHAGDDDQMINLWTITKPDGSVVESESANFEVPDEPGSYVVTVEIGGSYAVEDIEFVVLPRKHRPQ